MARVKSRGCRKITTSKTENETCSEVTFSKHRNSLLKKANEICTLTGAQVGIIILASCTKVYPFGNPSIDSIIERYEAEHPPPPEDGKHPRVKPHFDTNLQKLKGELDAAKKALDVEKMRAKILDQLAQAWKICLSLEAGVCSAGDNNCSKGSNNPHEHE